jgi:predicted N-acyltransferase
MSSPVPADSVPTRAPLRLRVVESIADVPAAAWDACAGQDPFSRHGFFSALEQSRTIGAHRGILPRYVCLFDAGGILVAAAAAMLKSNTWGEYGPEIAWLRAAVAAGQRVLPKFQVDVPLTPVMGRRLLVHPRWPRDAIAQLLLQELRGLAERDSPCANLGFLRLAPSEARLLAAQGFLLSHELRSAWRNPGFAAYTDFLAALRHGSRSMIQRERRKVAQSGLELKTLSGHDVSPTLWRDFHRGYVDVCHRHGGRPWMSETFFPLLAQQLPDQVCMLAAFAGDAFVGGALCLRSDRILHVRHWSLLVSAPALVFELTLHRPLELACEERLDAVDGGVYGKHKAFRCYLPEAVPNAHWIPDPRLRRFAAGIVGGQRRRLEQGLLAPGQHAFYRHGDPAADRAATGFLENIPGD